MEESVNKFIDYLEGYLRDIEDSRLILFLRGQQKMYGYGDEDLKGTRMLVEDLLEFLEMSDERILNTYTVYLSFNTFSNILGESDLTVKEKTDCLMTIIRKNLLSVGIDDSKVKHEIINLSKFKEKYAPKMDPTIFANEFKNFDFNRVKYSSDEDLSAEEILIKQKLIETEEESRKENELFIKYHQYIKEHYLDKLTNYNEKDIKGLNIALENLGINSKMRTIVTKFLTKNLPKQEESHQNENNNSSTTIDYNAVCNELREVIDFETMMPYRPLRMQERIKYLTLLTKINYPKEKRRTFLRNSEILRFGETAYLRYLDSLDKLKYYEEKVGLQRELESMKECASCIETYGNDRVYDAILDSELKQVESWIPKNFEYEETEAKRLLSK